MVSMSQNQDRWEYGQWYRDVTKVSYLRQFLHPRLLETIRDDWHGVSELLGDIVLHRAPDH